MMNAGHTQSCLHRFLCVAFVVLVTLSSCYAYANGQRAESATASALYDFDFRGIRMQDALQELALIAGVTLKLREPLQETIYLKLEQVSITAMLHYLVHSYQLSLLIQSKSDGAETWTIGRKAGTSTHAVLSDQHSGRVLASTGGKKTNISAESKTAINNTAVHRRDFVTRYFRIKYHDAETLTDLLKQPQAASGAANLANSAHGFLSPHANVIVDSRSQQIILRDLPENIAQVAAIIDKLDRPLQQVLLEASIVMARTSTAKELGIRWGMQMQQNKLTLGTIGRDFTESYQRFTTPLAVDLGVLQDSAAKFQVNYGTHNSLIELELSALELDGKINILSKPRIATIDGHTARISSGVEIPFVMTNSEETNTAFKEATLSLEIQPRIMEEQNILMTIRISQDAAGEFYDGLPSIDTNKLQTKLRIANQQTIVLGGIVQTRELQQVTKVPFLGDIPLLKWLFRRDSQTTEKAELLIFITPRIMR